jgi:Na+/proline symporter
MTGFIGAAYFAARGGAPADAETVFLVLAQILFHPFVAGFVLAAVLAAIMSTISSQLLVTSSSLTEDIYKTFVKRSASERELVTIGRSAVVLVSIVAGLLALNPDNSILSLVGNAWAGFGAAFGPAVLFSLRRKAFWRAWWSARSW